MPGNFALKEIDVLSLPDNGSYAKHYVVYS